MSHHTKNSAPSQHRRGLLLAAGVATTLTLGACADRISVHGNMPDDATVEALAVGLDDRAAVQQRLGTPSTLSTFQDDKWIYIGTKMERFAFMKPQPVDRRVLVVSFDEAGTLDDKSLYTLEDGQIVDLVDRTTPTEGRELTLLQQLFGNLGRFSSDTGATIGGARGPDN